jgi:hypothetical protein
MARPAPFSQQIPAPPCSAGTETPTPRAIVGLRQQAVLHRLSVRQQHERTRLRDRTIGTRDADGILARGRSNFYSKLDAGPVKSGELRRARKRSEVGCSPGSA